MFSNKAVSTHLTDAKMITSHSRVAAIECCEHECTVYEKCMSVSGTCICNMELPLTEVILS